MQWQYKQMCQNQTLGIGAPHGSDQEGFLMTFETLGTIPMFGRRNENKNINSQK